MSKTSLPTLTAFIQPDAPEDFKPDRRCARGPKCKTFAQLALTGQKPEPGKVNRYRRKMGSETKGPQGPLLCTLCARDYLDDGLAKAIEREVKRQRAQQFVFLPKLEQARKTYGKRTGHSKLSQQALAKMVGTNDTKISAIERGEQGATFTMCHDLARSLGVSVDSLRGKA